MKLLDKEHYDLMEIFESDRGFSLTKEPKRLWAQGHVYQNGHINDQFIAFRKGYAYGKTLNEQRGN